MICQNCKSQTRHRRYGCVFCGRKICRNCVSFYMNDGQAPSCTPPCDGIKKPRRDKPEPGPEVHVVQFKVQLDDCTKLFEYEEPSLEAARSRATHLLLKGEFSHMADDRLGCLIVRKSDVV